MAATSGFEAAVTGLGMVTPAGVGTKENWSAVRAGVSRAAVDPSLDPSPVQLACRVTEFDAGRLLGERRALRLDPFVHFALVAAAEALSDAGLDPATWDGARVGVVLGTADGGPGTVEAQHRVMLEEGGRWVSPLLLPMQLPNMLAGQLAIEYGCTGPNLVVATACASGASAIGTARDLLAADRCDVVLTGGSEAMLTPLLMSGFAQMGALSRRQDDPAAASRPFDADRDGFVAGEGAGVLVMERAADARARGATVHGRIVGYGASADAHHMTKPRADGRGTEAAVRAALADAGLEPSAIGHVNAHGTATPLNDLVEGRMIERVLPHGPRVTSTKGVTGHLLGASGAIETIYTLLALKHGVAPPTANLTRRDDRIDINVSARQEPLETEFALNNSFGFGGQNAVLVAAAP
ncbi:beta-ketoacyl-[acyl-carrier-protein] synthase family protein [Streptomyces alkaliterrae]|uniref:Beta-ketoacyl-ACP synthase II n=1 Tax=Streptomyces alkaliterrae TaxID=2213162 RepID=A0A5P0YTM1_9ACTN|nr:beta-ketoacyl-[acyl-carrier-protein] synthase family protein [Streptomyces alkaliterrae]MBB1253525.1 beta-ketoacyl-[acyl-carrier-protein] synthase family protein [Streptomyces alkaliterrae]MBB1258463.1 beta-ketoacyl-[acyl-carrier-protein] synthase family protein [Streptomyces alkaliterrae]MQS01829.1 beta-ketoacyl-ACP synthase II [Streptomyces alkaliterrae]